MFIKFGIVVKAGSEFEQQFWDYINSNEICTVQADCEYNDELKQWEVQIIPQWDDSVEEFFALCKDMHNHFQDIIYNN